MRSSIFIGAVLFPACWAQVGLDDHGIGHEPPNYEPPNYETPNYETQCEPGSLRCNGATLELCVDDGITWATLDVCESAGLCDPEQAGCIAPRCIPDETRCSDSLFQRCAREGRGWEISDDCSNAASCDAVLGCQ